MANFTSVLYLSGGTDIIYYGGSNGTVGGSGNVNFVSYLYPSFYEPKPKKYIQRVYDNTLGRFCYFDNWLVIPTPSSSQTIPNHTNNLKSGSHEIVQIYYQDTNVEYNFANSNPISYIDPVVLVAPQERYVQRIFDNTLQTHCYFTSYDINSTPISSSTIPNHTNNIKSGSHEIVQVLLR